MALTPRRHLASSAHLSRNQADLRPIHGAACPKPGTGVAGGVGVRWSPTAAESQAKARSTSPRGRGRARFPIWA